MSQTRLYVTARKPEAHHLASILDVPFEEEGVTSILFETAEDSGVWCYSIYVDADETNQREQQIKDLLGSDAFGLKIEREELGNVDWISQTLRELKPVEAGRFFIHGSHDTALAQNKRVPVQVDAGQAFGTGHHGTTAGCLDMLELVLRQRKPNFAMDIGTGSGVLAMALAKAARIPVLATDIDPISEVVARENCQINGVGQFVTCRTATGFQHPVFREFGQADLLFANILARPLESLAHPMQTHLAPGADVILSGLLPHQRSRIVSAYNQQGLHLKKWHIRDGWLTLLMRKP